MGSIDEFRYCARRAYRGNATLGNVVEGIREETSRLPGEKGPSLESR
jgi:hypothetical protein